MTNPSITTDIAGKILSGGARLYGFGEEDFAKADLAAKRHDNIAAGRAQGLPEYRDLQEETTWPAIIF